MPISDYTPTLDEVGALIRDRTVDAGGNEVGTFTADTRPTDTEAESIISDAANEAYTMFGEDIPDAPASASAADPTTYDPNALRTAARKAVAYHAAALIELSHFGEQVARGNSPYQQYEDLWNAASKRIAGAIDSTGGATPSGASNEPVFDFPQDAGGMVGWGTRF